VIDVPDEFDTFLSDFKPYKIGNLFSTHLFIVPPNQRLYSWDIENWLELWNDLLDLIKYRGTENRFEKYHFFGPMFFIKVCDDETLTILDGQQRMATISILLSLIRDLINLIQSRRPSQYDAAVALGNTHNCLFYNFQEETRVRLRLGEVNDEFFQKIIKISQSVINPLIKINTLKRLVNNDSDKKILECYSTFLHQFYYHLCKRINIPLEGRRIVPETLDDILANEESINFLVELCDSIVNKLYVLKIVVPTYDIEYEIFETLNQRGEKLEVKYLFKNLIFRLIQPLRGEEFAKNIWNRIEESIGEDLDEFLLHYWRSKFEFVRTKKLFRALRKHLQSLSIENLENFINEMIEESKIYFALQNPEDDIWAGRNEISDIIDEINYLKLKQALPLLLASYIKSTSNLEKFKELLKAYKNLCVRAYTVLRRNPNEFEEEYSKWSIDIRNNRIRIDNVVDAIEEGTPNDGDFKQGFIELEIRPDKARYLISKINDALVPTPLNKVWRNRPTLEHIIPQKPNQEWKRLLESNSMRLEKFISRLGNMTILSASENTELGNISYNEKRQKYLSMNLPINDKTFQDFPDFNENIIKRREEIMADLAVNNQIW